MQKFTKLGLSWDTIRRRGMEAAVAEHDKSHSISYKRKKQFMESKGKVLDEPLEDTVAMVAPAVGYRTEPVSELNSVHTYASEAARLHDQQREQDRVIQEARDSAKYATKVDGSVVLRGTLNKNPFSVNKTNSKETPTVKKQAIKVLDVNKKAAVQAAYLAMGKLVVDTATRKLPKEVGILGPMVVAELVAAIPAKPGSQMLKFQEAALAYAMMETFKRADINKLVEELISVTDEIGGEVL